MHGPLFYGFLVLLAYTTLIFIQDDILPLFTAFTFLQGDAYLTLELLGDTFGVAYVFGLAVAVYRRFVKKLDRLETVYDDYFVVAMLVWIGLSGFMIEALRLIIQPVGWAGFSPVGNVISQGPCRRSLRWWLECADALPRLLVGSHVLGHVPHRSGALHQAHPCVHVWLQHRPHPRQGDREAEHAVQPTEDGRKRPDGGPCPTSRGPRTSPRCRGSRWTPAPTAEGARRSAPPMPAGGTFLRGWSSATSRSRTNTHRTGTRWRWGQ